MVVISIPAVQASTARARTRGRDTITVMPFENLSGRPEYNWIGESFAESLAVLLDQPGLAAIMPDERDVAYKEEGLPPTSILTHATMFKIAERAGANLVVMGTYRVDGEGKASTINYTARAVNINEGRLMGREQSGGGPLIDLERLQGELAFELLYQHDPALPVSRDQVVARATAAPIGAFENYIKGKLTREHDSKVGFLERAEKEYSEKNQARYTAAAFELGRIHYDDGDYSKAVEELRNIDEKDPRSSEAGFYIACAENELNQPDKSLADFSKLKGPMPLFEVYNNVGVLLLKSKQYAEAINHLKPASDASPRDTDTMFNLGYAYYLADDSKNAAEILKKEIERRPSDPEAAYILSKALGAAGDQTGAAKASDEAKKLLPSYAQWETKGAPFLGRMKSSFSKINYYRYKRDLEEKIKPQSITATQASQSNELMDSARTAYAAGRDDEALATLGKLLQAEPQSFEAHLLMGRIYERRGDTDRAVTSLKAALFWNPKLAPAMILLGRIAVLKNDCATASSWSEKALQLNPNDADAQALKRILDQKCGSSHP
jgi:Tfp pilus assembly protein PilF/TolB-like protein